MAKARILSLHIVPGESKKDVQQIGIIPTDESQSWNLVFFNNHFFFTTYLIQSENVLFPEEFHITDFLTYQVLTSC